MLRMILAAVLIAVPMMAGAARAESTILMGAYGPADVERSCRAAGGRPTGIAGVTYGCVKDNCDGKGGQCSITCVEPTKCLATTPAQLVRRAPLIDVLRNSKAPIRKTP